VTFRFTLNTLIICIIYIVGKTGCYTNVYNLGPTIHNQVLTNDMVKVAVAKVIDGKAQVHVPSDEVTTIVEAVNTFIKWPKRLLRVIANKVFIIFTSITIYT